MTDRITDKQLQALVDQINKLTGSPMWLSMCATARAEYDARHARAAFDHDLAEG